MKGRAGFLAIVIGGFVLALASCGGGGGGAALNLIPEGDYYSISGMNIAQRVNSPMYKEYVDEVDWAEDRMDEMEKEAKRMGIDFEQYTMVLSFNSTDVKENLTYHGGPRDADDFEDYCEKILNLNDFEEEEENGVKYYVAENVETGYLMAAGGALIGHKDALEDVIDVMTKGDDKLVDDKKYREHMALVDYSASQFMFQWDELDDIKTGFKGYIRQVDDDEDLQDAVDDLDAWSIAFYWRGNLEVVLKFKFDDEKPVQELGEFLEKEMDEFFDKLGEAQLRSFFRDEQLDNLGDIEDLAEKARVNRSGKILEIRFSVTWDDLKNFLD